MPHRSTCDSATFHGCGVVLEVHIQIQCRVVLEVHIQIQCRVVLEVHFQWLLVLLVGHTDRVVGSSSTTSPSSTSSTASTLWLPRC